MEILSMLSAKQFIVLLVIASYFLMKTSFISDFIEPTYNRYNFLSKLNEINSRPMSKPKFNNETENDTKNELNSKVNINQSQILENNNKQDVFCNPRVELLSETIKKLKCYLNKKQDNSDIYKPVNLVPYNFTNNLNNNILYSFDPKYNKDKLNYDKKLEGDVMPFNKQLIHKNFDKNVDNYKIITRIDTILNLIDNNEYCFIHKPLILQKNLKLFTRLTENFIEINWNIPILGEHYFPGEIVFTISGKPSVFKKYKMKKTDMYKILFDIKECHFKTDLLEINSYRVNNRIVFNLKTLKKDWYNEEYRKHIITSKVYFLFKYYDFDKTLKDCFLESNISKIAE